MTININIKATVNNISLPDLYLLLSEYQLTKKDIIEFNGFKFKIEAEIGMSINYIITEIEP